MLTAPLLAYRVSTRTPTPRASHASTRWIASSADRKRRHSATTADAGDPVDQSVAVRPGYDGVERRAAEHRLASECLAAPVAVDCRRLRACLRKLAAERGALRRPVRPPPGHDRRACAVRGRVRLRRVLALAAGAHCDARGDGHRWRDPDAD